jgi:hypothetical protein
MRFKKLFIAAVVAMVSSAAFAAPSDQGQSNGLHGGTPRAQDIRHKTPN